MMVSQFIRESVRKGHGGTQVYAETLLNEVEFLERELAAERQKSAQLAGALANLLADIPIIDYDGHWEAYRCSYCSGRTKGEGRERTHSPETFVHEDSCVLMKAAEALQVASGSEGE